MKFKEPANQKESVLLGSEVKDQLVELASNEECGSENNVISTSDHLKADIPKMSTIGDSAGTESRRVLNGDTMRPTAVSAFDLKHQYLLKNEAERLAADFKRQSALSDEAEQIAAELKRQSALSDEVGRITADFKRQSVLGSEVGRIAAELKRQSALSDEVGRITADFKRQSVLGSEVGRIAAELKRQSALSDEVGRITADFKRQSVLGSEVGRIAAELKRQSALSDEVGRITADFKRQSILKSEIGRLAADFKRQSLLNNEAMRLAAENIDDDKYWAALSNVRKLNSSTIKNNIGSIKYISSSSTESNIFESIKNALQTFNVTASGSLTRHLKYISPNDSEALASDWLATKKDLVDACDSIFLKDSDTEGK